MRFHFFKQQTWKTGIKFCSKNYALPGPRNELPCATITISDLAGQGAKGLVGHLSNPLYCKWILEMYHIRGQNSHYKKLVRNGRIKEGSKNAPKAKTLHLLSLLLTWFLKTFQRKGLAYIAVRSIWTFDWPRVGVSQKVIPRERLPAPPHRVAHWKKIKK